jgi:hypothetical protein
MLSVITAAGYISASCRLLGPSSKLRSSSILLDGYNALVAGRERECVAGKFEGNRHARVIRFSLRHQSLSLLLYLALLLAGVLNIKETDCTAAAV